MIRSSCIGIGTGVVCPCSFFESLPLPHLVYLFHIGSYLTVASWTTYVRDSDPRAPVPDFLHLASKPRQGRNATHDYSNGKLCVPIWCQSARVLVWRDEGYCTSRIRGQHRRTLRLWSGLGPRCSGAGEYL